MTDMTLIQDAGEMLIVEYRGHRFRVTVDTDPSADPRADYDEGFWTDAEMDEHGLNWWHALVTVDLLDDNTEGLAGYDATIGGCEAGWVPRCDRWINPLDMSDKGSAISYHGPDLMDECISAYESDRGHGTPSLLTIA